MTNSYDQPGSITQRMPGPSEPPNQQQRPRPDRSFLTPDDAAAYVQPSRRSSRERGLVANGQGDEKSRMNTERLPIRRAHSKVRRRRRDKEPARSRTWKKLLWVKHDYPDNHTDEATFLDHLQRNPRLKPYEFWPLMAGLTVIVQHICSGCIFVCCFAGIFQEWVSPITVVTISSLGTALGWVFWDIWVGREQVLVLGDRRRGSLDPGASLLSPTDQEDQNHGLGLALVRREVSSGITSPMLPDSATTTAPQIDKSSVVQPLPNERATSAVSARRQQRLATIKSAVLIYCALLGLSPILKSLTKSTTSDSIWAMSFWLMLINVFSFNYRGGPDAKFSASLSTNAAVMASAVLASRLTDTTHVFSLTLFSIEVFGLFPIFRRYLRHVSTYGHLALTVVLVLGASGGVGVTISHGSWREAIIGAVLGGILTFFIMGTCCWWLIGLQKYKNEIHGPWDPARPVIKRQWD